MIRPILRVVPFAIAVLLAVGCAKQTRDAPASAPTPVPSASASSSSVRPTVSSPAKPKPAAPVAPRVELPEHTGVKACEDYLATYKACHRVIGAYAPDAIDQKYDELRSNLLQRSTTDEGKTQIQNQCASLAATMKEALNDRECTPAAPGDDSN